MSRIREKYSPFPMDRGIEKILRSSREVIETGPAADISPASSPVKAQLDELFKQENLEDYLWSQLTPSPKEQAMLMPARFNHALRDGVDFLLAAEEEDPRNAHIFRRARRLMGDQVKLRDLVQMYRSALLKG